MSNVYLKKYNESDIFNLTSECLPQQLNTIHKYSLKYTPTFSNQQFYKHFNYTRKIFSQQLEKIPVSTAERDVSKSLLNQVISDYIKYSKENNNFKFKNGHSHSNFQNSEWDDIDFISKHDRCKLVPSDKNMGPVWLEDNLIHQNTMMILKNKDNFTVDNRQESEIIKVCGEKIKDVIDNKSYVNYINKKQRIGIKKQICECESIPLMIPLIKIHKKPIQWRPVCRMSTSWVSFDLQKLLTSYLKKLLHDSQTLFKSRMTEIRNHSL